MVLNCRTGVRRCGSLVHLAILGPVEAATLHDAHVRPLGYLAACHRTKPSAVPESTVPGIGHRGRASQEYVRRRDAVRFRRWLCTVPAVIVRRRVRHCGHEVVAFVRGSSAKNIPSGHTAVLEAKAKARKASRHGVAERGNRVSTLFPRRQPQPQTCAACVGGAPCSADT